MRFVGQHFSKHLIVLEIVSSVERHVLSMPVDERGLEVHLEANSLHMLSSDDKLMIHAAIDHKTLDCFASSGEQQFREHGRVKTDAFVTSTSDVGCIHIDGLIQGECSGSFWKGILGDCIIRRSQIKQSFETKFAFLSIVDLIAHE